MQILSTGIEFKKGPYFCKVSKVRHYDTIRDTKMQSEDGVRGRNLLLNREGKHLAVHLFSAIYPNVKAVSPCTQRVVENQECRCYDNLKYFSGGHHCSVAGTTNTL